MMLTCLAGNDAATLPLHAVTPESLPALRATMPPEVAAFLEATGFTGKAQQLALLPGPQGLAGAVLGLGDDAPAPWSFGSLPYALPAGTAWRLEGMAGPLAEQAVLGWCLGAYRYDRFRKAERAPARLVAPPGTAAARIAAEAAWRARNLINTPANHLGPAELAAAVEEIATAHGARCEVVAGEALAQGFPTVAMVGQGSPRAPRVAILEWQAPGTPADAPLVALCGKGVCFDSGGLDLKPSSAMLRMKKDMGGAAVAIGLAEMVMRLRLPVRLLLLVGAVENAVSGTAFRPMDVVRTRAGLTVEIGNTDAEGRLVLCDLLALAAERKPDLLLDFATLTGAARVALGPDLPAFFTPNDDLANTITEAGMTTYDPVWRLPLHQGYKSWLDSATADINNVSAKPMAGAITAALFLQRFVPAGLRWGHFDLYAWNDSTRPGRPEGGEAQTMRAAAQAIAALFGGSPAQTPAE